MKNAALSLDIHNIRPATGLDVTATIIERVLDETVRYIEHLEGKEDRLTVAEQALNTVEESALQNKAEFLKHFEALKT